MLIDAGSDHKITSFTDGAVVRLRGLQELLLSIGAEVRGSPTPDRVEFFLSGPHTHQSTAERSRSPWSWTLFGQGKPDWRWQLNSNRNTVRVDHDFYGMSLPSGDYQVRADVYGWAPGGSALLDSRTVAFTLGGFEPSVPEDLAAHRSPDGLTLSWSPPTDDGGSTLVGYDYRSRSGDEQFGEWMPAGLDPSITLTAAEGASVTYENRARNIDETGPAASLTTPLRPSAPRNVQVASENGRLMLSWDAPDQNGGSSVSGYQYRYGRVGSSPGSWSDPQVGLSASIDGVTDDSPYLAEVRAANAVGHGSASVAYTSVINKVTMSDYDRNGPEQVLADGVAIVVSDYGGAWYEVGWEMSVETHPGIPVGSAAFEFSNTDGSGTATTWVQNDAPFGRRFGALLPDEFTLRVTVYEGPDRTGAELQSSAINFWMVNELPQAPSYMVARWGNDTLSLRWPRPDNWYWADFVRYEYRAAAPGQPFGDWISLGPERGIDLPNLDDGAAMSFEARARNVGGPGPSVSLSVPTAPSPPLGVTAVVVDGQATLSWTVPAWNGGASITGYQYRYGASGASLGEWTTVDGASSLTATISDSAIDEDTEYVFEVRGLNAANSDHDMLGSTAAFRGLTLVGVPSGDLLTLTDGAVVALSDYDTKAFAIRADTYSHMRVRSVSFELSGPLDHTYTHTENWQPYALYGDEGPDNYKGEALAVGQYRLVVTAYGGLGGARNELQTLEINFTVVDRPQPPQDLAARWTDGALRLSWSPPANSEAVMVTGYEYRIRPENGAFGSWTSVSEGLGVEFSDVADGAVVDYEVRALSDNGEGLVAALRTPSPPGSPTLTLEPGDAMVSLSWSAPLNNGGETVSGYEYRIRPEGRTVRRVDQRGRPVDSDGPRPAQRHDLRSRAARRELSGQRCSVDGLGEDGHDALCHLVLARRSQASVHTACAQRWRHSTCGRLQQRCVRDPNRDCRRERGRQGRVRPGRAADSHPTRGNTAVVVVRGQRQRLRRAWQEFPDR